MPETKKKTNLRTVEKKRESERVFKSSSDNR